MMSATDKYFTDTIAALEVHEGFREKPYQDTLGVWTFGHGLTYLSETESLIVMKHRLENEYLPAVRQLFVNFEGLNDARKSVLLNMCYNLGPNRLEGFKRLRSCVRIDDFEGAAREMLNSKWAAQVGHRANELAEIMRTGVNE